MRAQAMLTDTCETAIPVDADADSLERALAEHFGFSAFRPGQWEACAAALAGRDTLVVMPTGSGKSLCYQLPALMREDLTIVVSPLVSLMQDQVDALAEIAGARVALVNAQQDAATNRAVLERAVAGELRLLYVAPERFGSGGFVRALEHARIGLFVVDEAHCVSQWGHDFRPDYFRLADAAEHLGAQAIIALTATATPRVASDVAAKLRMDDPVRVTTGFDRPNLSFAVVPSRGTRAKHDRIVAALAQDDALPAIVYAGTRRGCEELAPRLTAELGVEALVYHAGLRRDARAGVQRRFMAGEAPIVVATNAFGMGVDKANVRTVCHATVPGSLEAFYQEAGRAGRDGRPARCLLFAEPRDKGLHTFFIERAQIDDAHFAAVAGVLEASARADGRYDVALAEVERAIGGADDLVRAVLGHLASAGAIAPTPATADRVAGRLLAGFDRGVLARCRTLARDAQQARWRQYRAVWAFVEGRACRRTRILRHFGDGARRAAPQVPCCDVCDASILPPKPARLRRGEPAPAAVGGAARGAGRARGADRGRAGDRAVGAAASAAGASSPGGASGPANAGAPVALVAGAMPAVAGLDAAIVEVVAIASPPVGRTRAVEILRGGRSKVIRQHSYDGLPPYGTFGHLSSDEILGRVDELLGRGRLRSTGGRFPKLRAA